MPSWPPAGALTYILAFIGIVSSIAADAGYLVLIPLAAAAYVSIGRHPLAGLALSVAIFACQIPLSAWWLRRHHYGPVEWALRGLTHGQAFTLKLDGIITGKGAVGSTTVVGPSAP